MALISCPECKVQISDKAVSCPRCGNPMAIQGVAVKAVDPFAVYHTPIQGKKDGNLTVLGKIGIGVGAFMFLTGLASTISSGDPINLFFAVMGIGFSVASYFWARK